MAHRINVTSIIHPDPAPDSLSDAYQDDWDSPRLRNVSVDEYFAARDWLLKFVPSELASIILDAALYWPSVTARRTDLQVVCSLASSSGRLKNAAAYYLITPPIPQVVRDSVVLPTRVRMVIFRLVSCDQGFGGSLTTRGTYEKSPTWLEASILRNANSTKIDSLLSIGAISSSQLNKISHDVEVRNMIDEATRRWHVQSNKKASSGVALHEVTWSSEDVYEEKAEIEEWAQGRGTGRGFIRTLSTGDRVGVVARARVPLWHNHVFGVKVDIFYSP